MKHGGKREGAGRKKSEVETTTIAFRVPVPRKKELHKKVADLLKVELSEK